MATIRLTASLALLLATVACGPAAPERSAPDAPAPTAAADTRPRLLFLGDSLTAGLGVAPEQAFPALIQERVDRAGLPFRVVNAGVSGDTSAGGLRRIDWLAREPIAVLVLALGANDMLRGLPNAALRENLQQIIDRARAASPGLRLLIAGMRAAPNLGRAYAEEFAGVFAELARANGAAQVPFLLEGVAGVPELNQGDGIHPTPAGHRRVADTLWPVLEPLLRDAAAGGRAAQQK